MTLGEKQELFSDLESLWVTWVLSHRAEGWKLRQGEGTILQRGPDDKGRKARLISTGAQVLVSDAVHMDGGCHYMKIAKDWNLFVNGEWIANGEHPVWVIIGTKWESLHVLARWGGRWGDGNHISLTHNGKK